MKNEYAIEVLERELEEITTLAGDNPEYLWKIKNLKYTLVKLKSDQQAITHAPFLFFSSSTSTI